MPHLTHKSSSRKSRPFETPVVMETGTNTRQKSKRPQLACSTCRARKVKCDRLQPCTACSLNTNASNCHYDLTPAERQPILQAEALRERGKQLKEKDKVIAQLQIEKRNLEELLKKTSPPSEPTLPSAWTNPRFDGLPAKYSKTQHAIAYGFTPEAPFTTGSMEPKDRSMSYHQDSGFSNGAPGHSNKHRALITQGDLPHSHHSSLNSSSRNLVMSNSIHPSQREHNGASECYSSTPHHVAYNVGQMEVIGNSQTLELRNSLASKSAISEPCSPTKNAHRKASTSSDTKPRATIMKRSWKPPTPPSSQNSEEAWQIPTFQLPSQIQKTASGQKSRAGSHVSRIDTTHQDSNAVESPLSSATQAQQRNLVKALAKHHVSPQTEQSNGWFNTFPMPQTDTPMPTLIGGVALPLRRSSSQTYQMNLPGPFNFLGRDLDSAPQYQQQVIGQQNLVEQSTTAFSGSCDVPMQDANCFTPWVEPHHWPTWQEAPVTYQ